MKWQKKSSELYVGYVNGLEVTQIQKHQRTRYGYGRWPERTVVETFWLILDEETGHRTIFRRLKDAKAYIQARWDNPGE